jgi:protein CpxP
MRKVTAAVMASTLAFSAFSQAAEAITSDNGSPEGKRSTAAKAICLTA